MEHLAPPLIGRTAELSELRSLVQAPGVVLLVGPAGVGKSRLLAELSRELESSRGIHRVNLRGVSFAAVFASIADAVGAAQVAADESLMRATCLARLRQNPGLLVLDNSEHLAEYAQHFVDFAMSLPSQTLLICSRIAWSCAPAPRTVQLQPLLAADTKMLLRGRLAAHRIPLNEDAEKRLAEAVQGLPLAIEIAVGVASRVGVEHAAELLRAPSPHQALRATMQASLDLLQPADLELLCASVLLGGRFSGVELLELMQISRTQMLSALERLASASLVFREGDDLFATYPFVAEVAYSQKVARRFYVAALRTLTQQLPSTGTPRARLAKLRVLESRLEQLLLRLADDSEFEWRYDNEELRVAALCLVELARHCHYDFPPSSVLQSPQLQSFCAHFPEFHVARVELATIGNRFVEAASLMTNLGPEAQLTDVQRARVFWCQAVVLFWASDAVGSAAAIRNAVTLVEKSDPSSPYLAVLQFSEALVHTHGTDVSKRLARMQTILADGQDEPMSDEVLLRDYFMGALLAGQEYPRVVELYDRDPWVRLGAPAAFNVQLHRAYALIFLDRIDEADQAIAELERDFSDLTRAARTQTAALALALQRGHAVDVQRILTQSNNVDAQPELVRYGHHVLGSLASASQLGNFASDASIEFVRERTKFVLHPQMQLIASVLELVQPLRDSIRFAEVNNLLHRFAKTHHEQLNASWGARIVVELAQRLCCPLLGLHSHEQSVFFDGTRIELAARPALWRVLLGLVRAHRNRRTVRAEELHEMAWPGERGSPKTKENRIRVSVHYLREMGLKDLIENQRPGYRLIPNLRVVES